MGTACATRHRGAGLAWALGAVLAACSTATRDYDHHGMLTEPRWFGIGNLTVVRVDPAGREVRLAWRGFNIRGGDALNPPWEELELVCEGEAYLITDKGLSNNQLLVNGERLDFRARDLAVHVTFGQGVSIAPGIPYEEALHIGQY